jgi:hypothetical protein
MANSRGGHLPLRDSQRKIVAGRQRLSRAPVFRVFRLEPGRTRVRAVTRHQSHPAAATSRTTAARRPQLPATNR